MSVKQPTSLLRFQCEYFHLCFAFFITENSSRGAVGGGGEERGGGGAGVIYGMTKCLCGAVAQLGPRTRPDGTPSE